MHGWSMSVGEIKKALSSVPDDYEIMVDNAEVDDCEIAEVHIRNMYPPALDSPGLVILSCGQVVTSEYDYHPRMDADHMIGGTLWWNSQTQEWRKLGE